MGGKEQTSSMCIPGNVDLDLYWFPFFLVFRVADHHVFETFYTTCNSLPNGVPLLVRTLLGEFTPKGRDSRDLFSIEHVSCSGRGLFLSTLRRGNVGP